MKHYTVGFVFNATLDRVLLMHKLKPEWQAGKVNGLGGKIEEGEEASLCVAREICEEASLITKPEEWIPIGTLNSYPHDAIVEFFGLIYQGSESDARSLEQETIDWYPVDALPANIVPNLAWLIPITLNKMQNKGLDYFDVREHR